MNLCTLAYPKLSAEDYQRIQDFRKHNDRYFRVVEPHFTLIFPTTAWEPDPYLAEVEKQARRFQPFDFCIRGAALNKDAFQDLYHAFLVPDEGHAQITKLHYRLCAGRFFYLPSLDIDFIPHIGIGNSEDPLKCNHMVESWNREEFTIAGCISALDVANYENDTVLTIKQITLSG